MNRFTHEEVQEVFLGTALLAYFEDFVREMHPNGVSSLRAFENLNSEVFPDEETLQAVVKNMIQEYINKLSKIGEKYASN